MKCRGDHRCREVKRASVVEGRVSGRPPPPPKILASHLLNSGYFNTKIRLRRMVNIISTVLKLN